MKTTADVVIVGGGCMGCSVAWHLAQRGITNVVLLEREPQLATGSTGKNAGGVRHQFSHPANIELSKESIAMIARFEDIVGVPIDFHQDGYLFLLSKSANVETFKKNVALQQKHGVDVRWVSNEEARELAPGLDLTGVKGATYCPSDGVADPNGVTMGFAKGAQQKGVEIVREVELNGVRLSAQPRRRGAHVERQYLDADSGERRRPVGEIDRPHAGRRRARSNRSAATFSSPRRPAAARGMTRRIAAVCRHRSCWSSISRARSISTVKAAACCSGWAIRMSGPASTSPCDGISCRR